MKPPGLGFAMGEQGLTLRVSQPSPVEDAIWTAVEEALAAGWTPQRFKSEAASAWADQLREAAKDADREWRK